MSAFSLGEKHEIEEAKAIIEHVLEALSYWEIYAQQAGLQPHHIEEIAASMPAHTFF